MDTEKFIELQKQMRENNEEVQDFLKGLSSWKEEIANKSTKLHYVTGDSSLPAIRNSLLKRRKKKLNHKSSDIATSKLKMHQKDRIKSFDYKAWDKFDVDKALAEVDVDEKEKEAKGSSSSSETDEECERLRRSQLSCEARELGNIRFKEGRFEDAVEQYTLAVRLTPDDPVPYTNRAFALLRLDRHASAEADCSTALVLNANCLKALYRRALARKAMGNTEDAIADLQSVLRLDSANKSAQSELERLLASRTSVTGDTVPTASGSAPATAKLVQQNRRRTTVMRRIPIVEVGGIQTLDRSGDTFGSRATCRLNAIDDPARTTSALTHTPSSPASPNKPETSKPQLAPTLSPKVCQHSVPSNWFQLERELRELTNQHMKGGGEQLTEAAVDYLWSIPPDQYSHVIGHNLETSLLTSLLQVCHRWTTSRLEFTLADKVGVAQRLHKLSTLPRFDVAWLMAGEMEQRLFDRLMGCLQSTSLGNGSEQLTDLIDKIRKAYK